MSLVEFVHEQRWFGGKSLEVTGAEIVDQGVLRREPRLADALVELRYGDGNHHLYQLLHGEDEYDMIAEPSSFSSGSSPKRSNAICPSSVGTVAASRMSRTSSGPVAGSPIRSNSPSPRSSW